MLTIEEIKRFIDEDLTSDKKRYAKIGQKYYDAEHDILNYRLFYYNADGVLVEDTTRANMRIPHAFFTELVDQLASYMLSFDEMPIKAKENVDGLQEHLDTYFDDEFWAEVYELIVGTNAKGFEYLYGYKNAENRLAFMCADSLGVVDVTSKDTSDGQEYKIYWYSDRLARSNKKIRRIQVHTANEIYYFIENDKGKIEEDGEQPINPRPSIVYKDKRTGKMYGKGLGFIPFWRLDNNRSQTSGLKPIKALIDDYDLMECGLSNNLQDFDTPLHVVSGFQGNDLTELQQNLKTKKIIGVDEGGGVEVKTVDIPYQARKTKADEDEKNIYRFGMGFNSSQVGDGNITNIVIRSRYTLLDLKAGKLLRRLKRLLKQIIQVVLNEINATNGTNYLLTDTYFDFEYVIPTNESENAQTRFVDAQAEQMRINSILSAATVIGDDETLRAICEVLDLDYEQLKHLAQEKREVQNFLEADADLDDIEVDDEQ